MSVLLVQFPDLIPAHCVAPIRVFMSLHVDVVMIGVVELLGNGCVQKPRDHPIPRDEPMFLDQGIQDFVAVAVALEHRHDQPPGWICATFRS